MKTLRLVLGDQLNGSHSWYKDTKGRTVYAMMEMRQETDYVTHHIQKLVGMFSAMRRFAESLASAGKDVVYIKINDPENRQTLEQNLEHLIKKTEATRFEYQLPDEYRLDVQLARFLETKEIAFQAYDTEHFLSGRNDVRNFFSHKKRMLMESFYRAMRKMHSVLMEGDKPAGERWNYDKENRMKWKGTPPIPSPLQWENDCTEVYHDILRSGARFFGRIEPSRFIWPVNREQALGQLENFLSNRLAHFGTFQDSMTRSSWSLFHSLLSFSLNLKMLHPIEVVAHALRAWERRRSEISVQQIEGFVRQIIGWREYMRGIYWAFMPGYSKMNYFGHSRLLPRFYWNGKTKMECMRQVITQSLENAYAHHIQRLMVTGNFALLSEVDPDQVDAWYLGIYIDAFQWVEMPNTRGMSQYADGGTVATKPYVAASGYIHRMSDYCEVCHYDRKKRYGQNACPFNSLYWRFFHTHANTLSQNARLRIAYRTLDRMPAEEKTRILQHAEKVLDSVETL